MIDDVPARNYSSPIPINLSRFYRIEPEVSIYKIFHSAQQMGGAINECDEYFLPTISSGRSSSQSLSQHQTINVYPVPTAPMIQHPSQPPSLLTRCHQTKASVALLPKMSKARLKGNIRSKGTTARNEFFMQNNNSNSSIATHKSRQYSCTYCPFTCTWLYDLKIHLKQKHKILK